MRVSTILGLALPVVLLALVLRAQPARPQVSATVDASQTRPVAALAMRGQATAFSGPTLTVTAPLGVSAYRAYGVSRGWLAFSALAGGFPDEQLRVVDLVSRDARVLLPEWMVSAAAWRPGQLQLVALGYTSRETALLIVDATTGQATPISRRPTSPVGLRWAADGATLFAVHEAHPVAQRSPDETTFLLARYSAAGALLAEAAINPALLPVLAAVDDATLEDLMRQPLGAIWDRVPVALDPRGRLGAARSARAFKQPTVLWREGATLLIKDTGGPQDVDLYSLDVPSGTVANVAAAALSFRLPWQSPRVREVTQSASGYGVGGTGHTGSLAYAYDFGISNSDRVLASGAGTVVGVRSDVSCNSLDDGSDKTVCPAYSPACTGNAANGGWGNVVIISHPDDVNGSYTKYTHLKQNSIRVAHGQQVALGTYLGDPGHTGNTQGVTNGCGDHLHFQKQQTFSGMANDSSQSIWIDFVEQASPISAGASLTSQNTEVSGSAVPILTVNHSCALQGTALQFSGTQFSAGGAVRIFLKRTGVTGWVEILAGTVTANGAGNFASTFTTSVVGTYSVIARDETTWLQLQGDLNGDGIVNSLDWGIMNTNWFTSDAIADINRDTIVNSIDFSVLNFNWFKTIPPGGRTSLTPPQVFAVVPSPGC